MSTAVVNEVDDIPSKLLEAITDDEFSNYALLAKMLQMQFNDEYELNGGQSLNYNVEGDSEEEEIDIENWDTFDSLDKEFGYIPPQRVLKKDKKVKSKQDVRADMHKLSSKVFNSLNPRSYIEEFCKYKAYHDKRKSPVHKLLGIDKYSWSLIHELINIHIIKKIIGILRFDEDVITLRALTGHKFSTSACSIKIFKATSMPYNKAQIAARRKAEREVANCARVKAAGLPCLPVIMLKEHVLVVPHLEPTLGKEVMTCYTLDLVYEQVKKTMRTLFEEANLIHANLSQHNIVWYGREVYFINFSQAVDTRHEKAFDFLFRDCINVINAKIKQSEPVNVENSQDNLTIKRRKNYQDKIDKMSTTEINDYNEVDDIPSKLLEAITDDEFANDALLAKMLQMQFNDEYELNCTKRKYGGQSDAISSQNRQATPLNYVESDSEEEEIDIENWDTFDLLEKEFANVPPQRIHKKVKSKQDVRADMYKLSSKVFNSLNPRSYIEGFCKYKAYHDKRKKPVHKVLGIDKYSWGLIRELINKQVIKKVISIRSLDEDVITIRALTGHRFSTPVCSIKVFKATSMPYSKAQIAARQNAEREVANCARVKAAGLPCVPVIMPKDNVLVTPCLEPTLGKEVMNWYTYYIIFEQVKKTMRTLFVEANLIHAKLSPHNIVWNGREVYFINFSHAVDCNHEKAFDFLFRDCTNVVNFFTGRAYTGEKGPEGLFNYVTGYSYRNKRSLLKLQQTISMRMFKNRSVIRETLK